MTSQVYEQLLAIQDLDLSVMQLRHKSRNHPITTMIAGVNEELTLSEEAAGIITERRVELDKGLEQLSSDVAAIEARRSEIELKLYDGSVTGTKDLLALQDEAKSLKERQANIEDDELEIMEEMEQVDAELAPVDEQIRSQIAQRTEHEVELEQALLAIDEEVERLSSARGEAVVEIPEPLLAQYDALREDLGGVAVARLVGKTCDGCHMSLSAVAFDRIKHQDEDAALNCDQCGRLLIR